MVQSSGRGAGLLLEGEWPTSDEMEMAVLVEHHLLCPEIVQRQILNLLENAKAELRWSTT